MEHLLTITARELQEIEHALYYAEHLSHGTVGHNMLVLIAKLAADRGFLLHTNESGGSVDLPERVRIEG